MILTQGAKVNFISEKEKERKLPLAKPALVAGFVSIF
jgi:hypothetical protein